MITTVLKVFYKKYIYIYIYIYIIQYKSYKNFDNQVFQRELNSKLLKIDLNDADLSEFTEIFLSIIDKYASKKKKNFVRANNS